MLYINFKLNFQSENIILLINPKVGDKIIQSNIDSKLNEYKIALDEQKKEEESTANKDEQQAD